MEQINTIVEALVQEKLNEIMRAKYRKNVNQYRETHREQYNEYCRIKNKEYYLRNKERLNALRVVNNRKAKLAKQQKLQDEDTLGKS